MRVNDLTPPAVTPHVVPPDAPMARWPYQIRIALERLPQAAYVWDDPDPAVVYDDPNPDRYVWDAPFIGAGFTDALCDMVALLIDPGDIDELGLFPPTEMTLTLANPDGEYTIWTADGRLTFWAPGRRVCIWAVDVDTGVAWWLFSGRVASWSQNVDGTATVIAYDGLAQLADERGAQWTPGVAGQTPLTRIRAIATANGYVDPVNGDAGDNPLSTGLVTVSPLEACQQSALSDGGIFAGDADGQLIYRDRLWRTGRADQTTVPVFSDNVCTVPAVVWDPEMAADDLGLYTYVELVNVAGTVVTASLPAGDPAAWWTGVRYRLTHPVPDLWQTAPAGQTLADYLLAQSSTPAMALRAFTLYLTDPRQDLWRTGIGLRRGDRIRFLHDFVDADGRDATLDVQMIAATIRHEITPDTWVVTVAGTRTVDWTPVEVWDDTRFTWDDPDPANVWRY